MNNMARLGLFILLALVVLFGGIFIIGDQQRLFSRSYRLKTRFPTVAGLLAGAEVRVGGVRKGSVDEILLPTDPTGQVVVTMSLDRGTATLVKRDSVAAIETEGLLGSKFLAVSFGSPAAPAVRDWDTIASAPPLDVAELLKKTGAIMDTTQLAIQNANATIAGLASLTGRINRGEGTVGALVEDRTVYDHLDTTMRNLAATSVEAQATMVQARAGVTAFRENMQALKGNIFFRGYFKDRGYEDASDLTRWEAASLPTAAPVKTFIIPAKDLFDPPRSSKLKDRKRLGEAGAWLERNPFGLAVIQAFTGPQGDAAENRTLTQAQALVVRAFLVDRFQVDEAKVLTRGQGGTAPPEPGRDSWLEISAWPSPETSPKGKQP